jgi:ATP-dependent DNA helicase RecG
MGIIPELQTQLKWRELLPICMRLEKQKKEREKKGRPYRGNGRISDKVLKSLPFSLTPGQEKAIQSLREFLVRPFQFQGLLQGDVGSGKTLVGLLAAAVVMESKCQVALMVPTEILAMQQYKVVKKFLKDSGVVCSLLLGSTPASERRLILKCLKSADVQLIVGTHVLYSSDVIYKHLGFVIIDEQHRFGVEQRTALIARGRAPDVLYMSATPIPRTLTHTLYGDLENLIMEDMPPGRKPVSTRLVPYHKRADMYDFLLQEVEKGTQVYWVVPRILGGGEEKKNADLIDSGVSEEDIRSLHALSEELKRYSSDWNIEIVHGQLPAEQKDDVLQGFQRGVIEVLVSTTVIEVGIDVANANLMIIENPDRFGLAQLHQLRGRVGRGEKQAWCFLALPQNRYPDQTMEKLRKFCENNDGFEIAEMDLLYRGSGDVEGIQQSGFNNLRFTRLIEDYELVMEVRRVCREALAEKTGIPEDDIRKVVGD